MTLEQVRNQLAAALEGYSGPPPTQLRLDGLLLSPDVRRLAGRLLRRYRQSLNAVLAGQQPHLYVSGYGGGWLTIEEAPLCRDCGGLEEPGVGNCWRCQEQWELERAIAEEPPHA